MRSTVEEGSFQYAAGRGRFVLLGCGYLGLRVYRLLTELGWKGFAVVRSEESRQSLRERGVEVIALDIGTEDFSTRLKGEFRVFFPGEEGPEVWVHCASTRGGDVGMYRCVYYGGVSGLLRAFPLAYGIFVSSTSVYHQTDGSWVEENSTTEPSQESGRVLLETEKLVVGAGGGVARLAGLYGPGRSVLLRKFIKGEARIEMRGRRWINQIHVDDAARAVVLLCRVRPKGEVFNVADDTPMTQGEIFQEMARRLDMPMPPAVETQIERKRGNSSKRVSNAKMRTLGWEPQFPSFFDAWEELILAEKG